MMAHPFPTVRDAALALLNTETRLTKKAGSFLGQIAVDDTPLSIKQNAWLEQMLDRAGLPKVEVQQ